MPVYNAEAFLKETINSILNQTFRDFELLALDDGSTDHSAEIIRSYADLRIHYKLCPHNFIATLNKGIEMAQGKYIARMDHDDLMMPERLQIQYDYMEKHPEIAACGARMQTFGSSSYTINVFLEHNDIIMSMILCNPMANPTGFIRRSILTEHNIRHQDGYSFADDYKLWTEIAKVGKLANIPEILVRYRTSGKQTSVIHHAPMMEAVSVIQDEMLQYLLNSSTLSGESGCMAAEQIFPVIEILNKKGFLSRDAYLKFMYELLCGLKKRNNLIL
jgi:hypothetical protein